jgi:hypothetical protein
MDKLCWGHAYIHIKYIHRKYFKSETYYTECPQGIALTLSYSQEVMNGDASTSARLSGGWQGNLKI